MLLLALLLAAVPEDTFEQQPRDAVAGPGVTVTRSGSTLQIAVDVKTAVPNASTPEVRTRTAIIAVTLSPYLEPATWQAKLTAVRKVERAAWKTVKGLTCIGKDFSDHYEDGLCFRSKTPATEKKVKAYRDARDLLLDLPQHHVADSFSVNVRYRNLEPTDGDCGAACASVIEKVNALLTPYPPDFAAEGRTR